METKEAYLTTIKRHRRITREEELDAAHKRCEGDREGVNTLVKANLKLVIAIAREVERLSGCEIEEMELISAGNMGLIRAAEKFDPEKVKQTGAKFSTYASWWIKRKMKTALARHTSRRILSMPPQAHSKYKKIKFIEMKFYQEHGRFPTDEEVVEKTKFSLSMVKSLRELKSTVSLDAPISEVSNTPLCHLIGTDGDFWADMQKGDMRKVLNKSLSALSQRKRDILTLRFGLDGKSPKTLDETAYKLGLSYERIRQLQFKAFKELKQSLTLLF